MLLGNQGQKPCKFRRRKLRCKSGDHRASQGVAVDRHRRFGTMGMRAIKAARTGSVFQVLHPGAQSPKSGLHAYQFRPQILLGSGIHGPAIRRRKSGSASFFPPCNLREIPLNHRSLPAGHPHSSSPWLPSPPSSNQMRSFSCNGSSSRIITRQEKCTKTRVHISARFTKFGFGGMDNVAGCVRPWFALIRALSNAAAPKRRAPSHCACVRPL